MRIGVLTYGLDRQHTGIGRYTRELLQAMLRQAPGHELVLLTTERRDPWGLWQAFEHHALPFCGRLPLLETLGSALLAAAMRRFKLDLLHDPIGVAPLLLCAGHVTTVATVHDAIPWSYPGVSTALDTLIYRRWLPLVLPRVDHVITVSRASQTDIERYFKLADGKVSVVPEGVDPAFRPASTQEIQRARVEYGLPDSFVLYVGATDERKNLRRLLRAYAALRAKGMRQALVLVGPGHQHHRAHLALIGELGLEQHVVLPGYVRSDDLPAIYSSAELFVFPSLYEGFGLPVLEAMACGTPVVASNTASLPEVVAEAGVCVDPRDEEQLATAMQRVLSDLGLRAELVRRGLERAAIFTWDRTARETLDLYEQLSVRKQVACA